jgi:hypothetical protein
MTGNALGHAFLETVSPPLVGIGDTKVHHLCNEGGEDVGVENYGGENGGVI